MIPILLIALVILTAAPAAAGVLFVSPSGDDALSCTSPAQACRTLQRAVGLAPFAQVTTIYLAAGTYTEGANVYYYRFVNFIGNCDDPSAVRISVPGGQAAFWAQDHVIMAVSCMTVQSSGSGSAGIASRQYAIVDYYKVRFGAFANGFHVAAYESSRQNCQGEITIVGDAFGHANAHGQSFVSLACSMSLPSPRSFAYFVVSNQLSMINAVGAQITGDGVAGTAGGQYAVNNSTLVLQGTTLPGSTQVAVNGSSVQ